MADNEIINHFLVNVFNGVLKAEERFVTKNYTDLTMREIHLIEAVCFCETRGKDNRSTAIAKRTGVTAGTLTVAVSMLEKKGYLYRQKDSKDKRIVRIYATDKGKEVDAYHKKFHDAMVEDVLGIMTEEEAVIFKRALGHIGIFFRDRYEK